MLDGPRDLDVDRVLRWTDDASGLDAVLVLDDLTLGPAAGGVRTRAYASADAALADAAALARAMTIKCALAGLAAGGGKCVVRAHTGLDRVAAFARLGEHVAALGGSFRTAGDLGTTAADLAAMASRCAYVHADEGNLAASVARGLLRCVEALAPERGGTSVAGLHVAVQGAGAIGAAVARALVAAGARVVIADVIEARARAVADELGARVVTAAEILAADVDVLAPCAVGAVIDEATAPAVRAWAVCGAANNVVASAAAERALIAAGRLLVPDVIASAGAVIEGVGRTVMGLAAPARLALIDRLGQTARQMLDVSRATGVLPGEAAAALAWTRIGRRRT